MELCQADIPGMRGGRVLGGVYQLMNIALISESKRVSPAYLSQVAAALGKQAARDFLPAWGVAATVAAFPNRKATPAGYWPIVIQDNIHEPGAAGFHTDSNHQPYSLVQYSPDWTVTASHELLEMMADPWGNRLKSVSLPAMPGFKAQKVQMLVEVADPCEAFSYTVDDVPVSDFLLKSWYDPLSAAHSKPCSFMGKLMTPREVANGGYCSFVAKDGAWYQITYFGTVKVTKLESLKGSSLRAAVDRY